jgi:hypothetical protein
VIGVQTGVVTRDEYSERMRANDPMKFFGTSLGEVRRDIHRERSAKVMELRHYRPKQAQ